MNVDLTITPEEIANLEKHKGHELLEATRFCDLREMAACDKCGEIFPVGPLRSEAKA